MTPLLGPDGRPARSEHQEPLPPAPSPVVTVEEYDALKQRAAQADDYKDRWLRLQADFDNSRKRWTRDQRELEERAGERQLAAFLDVADDFERALAAAAGDTDPAHIRAGLAMIHRRMLDFLKGQGVELMNAAGQPFDPSRHEAVAAPEPRSEGRDAIGTEHSSQGHPVPVTQVVAEELRKGYLYRGRVLRPATVKVTGPAATPPSLEGGSVS